MIVKIRAICFYLAHYGSIGLMGSIWFIPSSFPGKIGRYYAWQCFKVTSIIARFAMRAIYGVRTELRGRELLPEGKCLFAAKHQSSYDMIMLAIYLGKPVPVIKQELLKVWVCGWYCARMLMIPIDRSKKLAALRHMCRQARVRSKEGNNILIFPEGTRRSPYDPPQYWAGVAFLYKDLDLPCVPVALNSGMFWPIRPHSILSRKKLRKPAPPLVFQVLPAIEPGLPRHEFMNKLEHRLESASTALRDECADTSSGNKT